MDVSRPPIRRPRSRLEWLLELVSIVATFAPVVMVGSAWDSLPERVPRHFGFSGAPDAWGPKGTLWVPVCLGLGLYVLFTFVRRLPPGRYNYPKIVTTGTAEEQYEWARSLLAWVKAVVAVLIAAATYGTIQVALGHRSGLSGWFLPLALAALALPWVATFLRRKRASPADPVDPPA